MDSLAHWGNTPESCIKEPGRVAHAAEKHKRRERLVPAGPTIEEHVLGLGMDYLPIAFTFSGTTTGSFGRFLTKLSEHANDRLRHNKQYFAQAHRLRTACALHRAFAHVFTTKVTTLRGTSGPYGPLSAEPPLTPRLPRGVT